MAGKKVYLAPSVFTAFVDRAHVKHEQAAAFFLYFAQAKYFLYTDIVSIYEAHRQIHYHISPTLARDFLRTIFLSDLNIIYPDEAEVKAALKMLLSYRSIDLTFEKALMATLAEKRGISQICTVEFLDPLFGQTPFYLPL
jgi:predicted nucleic acid-binding protein